VKLIGVVILLSSSLHSFAQFDDQDEHVKELTSGEVKANNVKMYNDLIEKAIQVHTSNDFKLFKEQRIPMKDKVGNIINIQLEAGNWYHFVFIGDPSCKKLKVTLFKEGIGDFVTNRTGSKNEEFYSEFSFICPMSGVYEFTCFQKGEMANPLAYLMLFKKNPPMAKTE
jgi:hypothetical protein